MQNAFKMMKQLREVKKVQKELSRKVVQIASPDGLVRVAARGDMTIKSIEIDPSLLDPSRGERLCRMIVSTINGALDSSKKAAAEDMAKLTSGLDLGGMFGS